jgi:hypothetical protein
MSFAVTDSDTDSRGVRAMGFYNANHPTRPLLVSD